MEINLRQSLAREVSSLPHKGALVIGGQAKEV